ncbi:MAG: thioredoxin family protein [Mesorhizobium sp.]|jgi:predicted dithiol-disulfide oxidoreductase (DUF899 family)
MTAAEISREEWIAAQKAHLEKEKELTRARDALAAARRTLPRLRIDKAYAFRGPHGEVSLADLFAGRSQLLVQHFMFAPEWEEGCVGCSFQADHVDAARQHFEQRDLSFAAVSRAPVEKIEAFRKRMGWRFTWVSSADSDFNYDFDVSFTPRQMAEGEVLYNYRLIESGSPDLPGISVFVRDEGGAIFRAASYYGRGDEVLVGAYNYLDLTPKGRDETGANGNLTDWVKHHDRYEAAGAHACRC